MTPYKPPHDAAALFARYKEHYEAERDLKPDMIETADRELKAGATVGELAKLTGLTPEVFRRRARALGVERKRPPTVGKLTPPRPATRQRLAAPTPEPHDFTPQQLHAFADLARRRAAPEQVRLLERAASTVKAADRDREVCDEAYEMGLITDADLATPAPAAPTEEEPHVR